MVVVQPVAVFPTLRSVRTPVKKIRIGKGQRDSLKGANRTEDTSCSSIPPEELEFVLCLARGKKT
jgi:hypothetical protein